MKNLWTSIAVNNMDDSVKFYSEVLGLTLIKRYSPMDGMELAFFGSGETHFELMFNALTKDITYGGHVSTGFQVESVEVLSEKLKKLNYQVSELIQPAPSIKFFFTEDPNGYKIQLVEMI